MFNQTNENEENYALVICNCGRKYIPEEMYICYK